MKKIMFNDRYGLTKAVLDARKTQTRRIISTNLYNRLGRKALEEGNTDLRGLAAYQVGEEVAVAQSYNDVFHTVSPDIRSIIDKIDCTYKVWTNKMLVRADLMPHRIRITNIRIERLQDISVEDCLKEGLVCKNKRYRIESHKGVVFYTRDVKLAFKYLINNTCGRGTWERNPYVFIYDFELLNSSHLRTKRNGG